jgi:hypothetical protein
MSLALTDQYNDFFTLTFNPQQLADLRGCLTRRVGRLRRLRQVEEAEHLEELIECIALSGDK